MATQKKAKAIYSYQGERASDLSFQAGDIINVVAEMSPSGPDWWEGEIYGKRGAFPLNHVEILLPDKKGKFDYGSGPGAAAPGVLEPKIGKPPRPEYFQFDHIAWKVALVLSIIAMVSMLIALIMPWYFIETPNLDVKEFQPFGIKFYSRSAVNNPRAVVISTQPQYTVYDAQKQKEAKDLHLKSFLLNLAAYFIQFAITILLFIRVRGYLNWVFYLPALSLVSFILILIAPLNYAKNINKVIADEIIQQVSTDPYSGDGPRVDFFGTRRIEQTYIGVITYGKSGVQTWGPTAAWIFAIIAIFPAFACYMTLFLVVLGRRVLCCGKKLRGGGSE